MFAAYSSAYSSHIREKPSKTKKLDSAIVVFFNKIKVFSDTLASIGQPLHPQEF
jgi:hypothetical protein